MTEFDSLSTRIVSGRPVGTISTDHGRMAEIKGPLLVGWLRFLKKRYGEAAVATAMERLRPDDRSKLGVNFLPSNWYAYDTIHSLRRLTGLLAGAEAGDPQLAVKIGRAMAHHAFTGVYRPLLKNDPAEQVAQLPTTADFFFRETRKLESRMIDATSCAVRYIYEKSATPTTAICASTGGFWCQTLELTGAKAITFEHPQCFLQGGPFCEFIFRWH